MGSYSNQGLHQTPVASPTTLVAALPKLHEALGWATEEVTQHRKGQDEGNHVAASIQTGNCRAICDGSFKGEHGTAGFCLHGSDPKHQIEGANRTPGDPADQSPYRSELGGIVGILVTAQAICNLHKITDGAIEIGLDCEGAIKAITAERAPKAKHKDFDLIMECRNIAARLPVAVSYKWIEGHQDDKGKRLDWWARQNIRMDQKAKRFWRKHSKNPRPAQQMSTLPVTIQIGDHLLTHLHKETAYEEINAEAILDYWERKDGIPTEKTHQVNWKASKLALKEQPRGLQRWHAKWATRHCAVGRMMKIRKEWSHNKCPLCGQQEETTLHVIQCTRATNIWNQTLAELRIWLDEQSTEPTLLEAIITNLQKWRQNTPDFNRNTKPALHQTLLQQNDIGWYSFILGRHAKGFERIQHLHYQSIQ
jgi:hypothetical protein